MWNDEIVEEVRKARDDYAAQFNYDLEAIFEDIRRQEEKSHREVVSLPPRKPELVELTGSVNRALRLLADTAASATGKTRQRGKTANERPKRSS
jgi:hypothetical protein